MHHFTPILASVKIQPNNAGRRVEHPSSTCRVRNTTNAYAPKAHVQHAQTPLDT